MSAEVRIPKLGMTATEVVLAEWMYADGEQVSEGNVLYTVETDKTATEIAAQASGTLRVSGTEGETYKVGDLIGTIE